MTKVFFVHLRRPKNARDQRDDPFYEFGSFGCTGCHSKNLLHRNRAAKLLGARLAFVQGGRLGSRLVFLTPPITAVKRWMKHDKGKWAPICEVKWRPADMPFRYAESPLLISNDGRSHFRSVMEFVVRHARCPSLVSSLSSLIRSCARELNTTMAKDVSRVYERWRRKAIVSGSGIASKYHETMLPAPKSPDLTRKATYQNRIRELVADVGGTEGPLHAELLPRARVRRCCGLA